MLSCIGLSTANLKLKCIIQYKDLKLLLLLLVQVVVVLEQNCTPFQHDVWFLLKSKSISRKCRSKRILLNEGVCPSWYSFKCNFEMLRKSVW